MVERAIILCSDSTISLSQFILPARSSGKASASLLPDTPVSLHDLEKQTIIQTLKKAKYIKIQAARLLNISRQALDRKIAKFRIPVTWK
jgi:DNA-binding NtrC family response regulator